MEITLIIPAHNEATYIGSCLDCAIRNSNGKFKEIIVVDNASTDGTAEIAARYRDVTVITEARKGTGHARQTGFERAQGDIIAYVDADVRIPEGWVEMIEQEFTRDQSVVYLSGPYRFDESARYPPWLLNALWWPCVPAKALVGYMATGGNCAIRREALQRIGGHDRSLSFYGDDTDLARRLHAVGKTLWRTKFNVYTSARRFDDNGLVATCIRYLLDYWGPAILHRPFQPRPSKHE